MPYIYTLAGMTNYKDYTIMRALVMDHGKDIKVNNIGDQYMFGPSLMICPVYKYEAREREVYFPSTSGWYDFYTGKFVAGNQTKTVKAPYEQMPIFVPEGAIIPFGPDIQYVGEKKSDNLTVYVYAGKNGSFELYEDEGVNYNYEKGASSKIRFNYNDATRTLSIENRVGSFKGMLTTRTFNIVCVNKQNATSFNLKNQKGKAVVYVGKKITIKL
jgi:alpha-D-xyloside xylohydrolase